MVIYYIGEQTNDKTIVNFCKEKETRAYVASGAINSVAELNAVCEEAKVYSKRGYIIVGLSDVEGINDSILTDKIENLQSATGGKVICYAPGRDDSKTVIGLQSAGVPCICDVFADKIKSKLDALISSKVPNENKSDRNILSNRKDNYYENEGEKVNIHKNLQGKQQERKAQNASTVLGSTANEKPKEKEPPTLETTGTVIKGGILSDNDGTEYEDLQNVEEQENQVKQSSSAYPTKVEGTAKNYYSSSTYEKSFEQPAQPVQTTMQDGYKRSVTETYNEPTNETLYQDIRRPYNENIRQENQYDNKRQFYNQSNYNTVPMQSNYDAPPMRNTIGVIGVINRIGTTTQAIHMTMLYKELSGRSCYVQMNQSSFLDDVIDYLYGVEIDSNTECIRYNNLELYKNRNQVFSGNYEHEVYDFGAVNETVPSEFFSKGTRIVVCGGTPEEVAQLTRLASQLYDDTNIKYIFSFVSEKDKSFILEMMGSKANNCYFAPYTPDCFELQEEDKAFYYSVLNIAIPETGKKKRGRRR